MYAEKQKPIWILTEDHETEQEGTTNTTEGAEAQNRRRDGMSVTNTRIPWPRNTDELGHRKPPQAHTTSTSNQGARAPYTPNLIFRSNVNHNSRVLSPLTTIYLESVTPTILRYFPPFALTITSEMHCENWHIFLLSLLTPVAPAKRQSGSRMMEFNFAQLLTYLEVRRKNH